MKRFLSPPYSGAVFYAVHPLCLLLFPLLLIFLTSVLCASPAFAGTGTPQDRQRVNLDGTWEFALLEPDGTPASGEGKSGKIQVPGIWDAQGFGSSTGKVRSNFIGIGRYQRAVTIPLEWEKNGLEPILVLEGISRYAKIFVKPFSEEAPAGETGWTQAGEEAIGLIGSHERTLAPYVQAGKKYLLRIDVDSRQRHEIDALLGTAQLNDYMNIAWGGLWGHVYVEGRPANRLKPVHVRTRSIDPPRISVSSEFESVRFARMKETPGAKISVSVEIRTLSGEVLAKVQRDVSAQGGEPFEIPLPEAKLWSPDSPNLYLAQVRLWENGKPADSQTVRFGIRELRIDGHRFLLNGRRLILRGYGDDHIYPREFSMPTDYQTHVKRLRLIKEYGFNHVRHHSTILPREYYDACDEVGIMPNAEFVIAYPQFLPGNDGWKTQVPEGTDPKPALDLYAERFAAVVLEYRNHPSILSWVMGNELWKGMANNREFHQIAKTLDPDRFFLDTDGDWANFILDPANDRETVDWYTPLFDEWANPVFNTQKFRTRFPLKKPAISHEAGNYTTFIRRDQAEMFEGTNYIPFWMTGGIRRLEELGLTRESDEWVLASEKLYFQLHKANVEGIRRNDQLSGYHWWLFQDYWTTSNGLVDYFFRPKSITPAEVRQVNSDLVFLIDGLEPTYRSGDELDVTYLASNYSSLTDIEIPIGLTPYRTQKTALHLPDGAQDPIPFPLSVSVKHAPSGTTYQNSWTTWIFPKEILPTQTRDGKASLPIYRDAASLLSLPETWDIPPLPTADGTESKLPAEAIYVAEMLDEQLTDALIRGARVVLLNASNLLPSIQINYQSSWWKAGDSDQANHNGTFIPPHPMVRAFAPEKYGHPSWCRLLQGAVKYKTEEILPPSSSQDSKTAAAGKPFRVQTIIRAIPSLVRVQDTSILFQVRVGKGTLTVSGLNHQNARNHPENAWILRQMIQGEMLPADTPYVWPAEFLKDKLTVRVPDGTQLGYRKIMSPTTETAVWYSFRKEGATCFLCRQTAKGRELSWQTVPVKLSRPAPARETFIFAGGLGFKNQPKTDGFEFTAGGETLRFDVPDEAKVGDSFTWKSDSGALVLHFDAKRIVSNGQDILGIFRAELAVSGEQAEKPLTFTVRSLGEGSHRWFSLNPELDLISP